MVQVPRLPPEQQIRHDNNLTRATPEILALARVLQRAAFATLHPERFRDDDFTPAPVYLEQATTFAANKLLRNAAEEILLGWFLAEAKVDMIENIGSTTK